MKFLERGAVADADEGNAGGAQLFVEEAFVFLVERAGGFVEKGDGRLFQKEPGESDALLLAEGKDVGPVDDFAQVAADAGEDVVQVHVFRGSAVMASSLASSSPSGYMSWARRLPGTM